MPPTRPLARILTSLVAVLFAAGCSSASEASPSPDGTGSAAEPSLSSADPPASIQAASAAPASGGGEAGTLPMGRLLFDSDRSGNLDIWLIEEGTDEPLQLTDDPASDRVANWGVGGAFVLFASDRDGGPDSPTGLRSYALWVVPADGTGEAEHLLGTRSFNHQAIPSPDGTQIAFYSDAEGSTQVYLMAADASDRPTAVTDDPVGASFSDWSPDGEQLLFSSVRHHQETPGNREIYVINVDGSGETRLTDHPADDGAAAFSPDGTRIAFHSDRDGSRSIYVMNADGSGITRLTDEGGDDGFPAWSPDGSMIAFETDRDGNSEIYVMQADGTGLVNVTNDPARDGFPAWGE